MAEAAVVRPSGSAASGPLGSRGGSRGETPGSSGRSSLVKNDVKRWKRMHEQTAMLKLTELRSVKKVEVKASKENARKLARKIPIELLAKDWLTQSEASIELRAYIVDKVMPTLILGVEKLLNAVDERGLASPEAGGGYNPNFNPLNFLAQYLMRNNPRYSNFSEASPYVRGLRQVAEELKAYLFDMEDNRLARIKAEAKRKREERELQAKLRQQEKERRQQALMSQFAEWNVPTDNNRVELSLLQNALRSFMEVAEQFPPEIQEVAKFGHPLESTDETGRTLAVTEFAQYLSLYVETLPPEVFEQFMVHMSKCANAHRASAERENRRIMLTNLFIYCDHSGIGLLDRHRILNLFEQFWDVYEDSRKTFRNPRRWPVVEVDEADDTLSDDEDDAVPATIPEMAREYEEDQTSQEKREPPNLTSVEIRITAGSEASSREGKSETGDCEGKPPLGEGEASADQGEGRADGDAAEVEGSTTGDGSTVDEAKGDDENLAADKKEGEEEKVNEKSGKVEGAGTAEEKADAEKIVEANDDKEASATSNIKDDSDASALYSTTVSVDPLVAITEEEEEEAEEECKEKERTAGKDDNREAAAELVVSQKEDAKAAEDVKQDNQKQEEADKKAETLPGIEEGEETESAQEKTDEIKKEKKKEESSTAAREDEGKATSDSGKDTDAGRKESGATDSTSAKEEVTSETSVSAEDSGEQKQEAESEQKADEAEKTEVSTAGESTEDAATAEKTEQQKAEGETSGDAVIQMEEERVDEKPWEEEAAVTEKEKQSLEVEEKDKDETTADPDLARDVDITGEIAKSSAQPRVPQPTPQATGRVSITFAQGTAFEREKTGLTANSGNRSQSQMSAFDESNLNVSQFVQLTETFLGEHPEGGSFGKLLGFLREGYEETEDEKMERLMKARKEAISANRKVQLDTLFEKWDNDGSGYLDIDEVEEVMMKYKEGQEKETISKAREELKKQSKYHDNRLSKKEFRSFVGMVIDGLPGADGFEYFVEFLANNVERSYAERVRGEARKKWLQNIMNSAESSGVSLDPIYKTVFQALYRDAEAHGGEKRISANIAMLERNVKLPHRGDVLLRYTACTPEDAEYILNKALYKDMKGISFAAVDQGKPIHVPRVNSHGSIHFWNTDRMPDEREGSFIVVPLKDRKRRVFGTLGIDTLADPHAKAIFITHEIQYFQGVAQTFSTAYHLVDMRRKLLRITESAISWIKRRSPHVAEIMVYMVEPGKGGDFVLRRMMTTDNKGFPIHTKDPPVRLERKDNLFRDYLFKSVDNSETVTADAYGNRHMAFPLRNDEGKAIAVVDISTGHLKKLPPHENKEMQRMLRLLQQAHKEITREFAGEEKLQVLDAEKDDDTRMDIMFDRLMLMELRENVSKLDSKAYAELKAYNSPPQIVLHILRATLAIFFTELAAGGEFDDWNKVKSYINNDLSQKVQAYDPTASDELISPSVIEDYLKVMLKSGKSSSPSHSQDGMDPLPSPPVKTVPLRKSDDRLRPPATSSGATITDLEFRTRSSVSRSVDRGRSADLLPNTSTAITDVPHGEVAKHGSLPAQHLYNWVFVCLSLIEHTRKMRQNMEEDALGSGGLSEK